MATPAQISHIHSSLSSEHQYVFSTLLEEVRQSAPNSHYIPLLEIYSYGTYSDYVKLANTLPKLSDVELTKLRILTIAIEASASKTLKYSDLLPKLGLSSIKELESLLIQAVYSDAIACKLDQAKQCVFIQHTIGHHVKAEHYSSLLTALTTWAETCESSVSEIKSEVSSACLKKKQTMREQEEFSKLVSDMKQSSGPSSVGPSSSQGKESGRGRGRGRGIKRVVV